MSLRNRLSRGVLIAALGGAFALFVVTQLGKVEGAFYPVTENTSLEKVEPVGNTRARIWGFFDRVRGCDFRDIEFYLGEPGRSAKVEFSFEEGAKLRSQGRETFGPWLVQLTPEQLSGLSYAIVYHRCYFFGIIPRPYLTETRFYP